MYEVTMCNPPGGIVYGFPRIMPHPIMTPTEFKAWMIQCGYPENELEGAENNSEFYLAELSLDNFVPFLREHTVNVTFTKTNGEERKMRCTLRREFLPEIEEGKEKKERKPNPNLAVVWDLEKSAWRSFRLDTVTYLEGEINGMASQESSEEGTKENRIDKAQEQEQA